MSIGNIKKTAAMALCAVLALAAGAGLSVRVHAEDCVRANPSVSFVGPSSQTAMTGQVRTYVMDVTNNDSTACLTSDFGFSAENIPPAPSVWNAVVTPSGPITLAPGATQQVTMDVASDLDPDGSYTLTMRSTQHYNDVVPTADVVVDTDVTYVLSTPPPQDTVAPGVNITSPSQGASIKRNTTVYISAQVTDNVGVNGVEYKVNNITLCSGQAVSGCFWTPTQRGTYTILVVAHDAAGNTGTDSITVTVK
jgi:hypothetical protein